MIRLGVNIDHVATLRNARGGSHPCPVMVAQAAVQAGADGITAHLREDRRHIRDDDINRLAQEIKAPLNMEMAANDEMLKIALKVKPNACCLVPERRQELTTEGGLDLFSDEKGLSRLIQSLKERGIKVSLFIDADEKTIEAAARLKADMIELHVGRFCANQDEAEWDRLMRSAKLGGQAGLEIHAGHGLDYQSLLAIKRLPLLAEVNIGHFIIGEAVIDGIGAIIQKMKIILSK